MYKYILIILMCITANCFACKDCLQELDDLQFFLDKQGIFNSAYNDGYISAMYSARQVIINRHGSEIFRKVKNDQKVVAKKMKKK